MVDWILAASTVAGGGAVSLGALIARRLLRYRTAGLTTDGSTTDSLPAASAASLALVPPSGDKASPNVALPTISLDLSLIHI